MSTDVYLYRKTKMTRMERLESRLDMDNPYHTIEIDSEDLAELLDMAKNGDGDRLSEVVEDTECVASVGNVTWNVTPMFTRAFGLEGDDRDPPPWMVSSNDRAFGLYHLAGATVESTAAAIRAALTKARELGEEGFADLHPPNDWGSWRCVVRILSGMVRAMEGARHDDYWRLC